MLITLICLLLCLGVNSGDAVEWNLSSIIENLAYEFFGYSQEHKWVPQVNQHRWPIQQPQVVCYDRRGFSGICSTQRCGGNSPFPRTYYRNERYEAPRRCNLPNGYVGLCCINNRNNGGAVEFPTSDYFETTMTMQKPILPKNTWQQPTRPKNTWQLATSPGFLTTTTQSSIGILRHDEMEFYNSHQVGCGVPNNKGSHRSKREDFGFIVGGSLVTPGAQPWFTVIGRVERNRRNVKWHCGGTLISPYWVITSAHCVNSVPEYEIRLFVGGELLSKSNSLNQLRPRKVVVHPSYGGSSRDVRNDVALIQIDRRASQVPICLPEANSRIWPTTGKVTVVLGYGRTTSGGNTSPYLQAATVRILNRRECRKAYSKFFSQPNDLICAKGGVISKWKQTRPDSNQMVRDACQGDSGGTLVVSSVKDRKLYRYIVGVVAGGKGCGNKDFPGIYISIKEHRDWIINTIVG